MANRWPQRELGRIGGKRGALNFLCLVVHNTRIKMTSMLLPAVSLAKRELVRFVRQRSRIVGALVTPIFFWIAIGLGMGRSFQATAPGGDRGFIAYFFPGTILMILLFTAIFSTISIIEDRREGFLQSVLVAPVSRFAVVLGKALGGTLLATAQGIIFLLLAPTIGIHFSFASFALALIVMLIVSFALTSLGICIAWRMSSTQGFHAIMNLFLMPMWFLSGALFPPARGAAPPMPPPPPPPPLGLPPPPPFER
jgi:ABC-2 type transport system permease protein